MVLSFNNQVLMREKLLTNAVKQPALLFLMVIPFPYREKPCVSRAIPPVGSDGLAAPARVFSRGQGAKSFDFEQGASHIIQRVQYPISAV
jgi:hypothetical protein